jgi:uncharacterized protein (DUF58 family)
MRAGRNGALVERQLQLNVKSELRVYPRFASSDEYRLLARIHHQDEALRRPRRVYGQGTDLKVCCIILQAKT